MIPDLKFDVLFYKLHKTRKIKLSGICTLYDLAAEYAN